LVHDEEVVGLGEGRVPECAQEGQFLGAGEGGEFLGVQACRAQEFEGGGGAVLEGGEVRAERLRRVRAPGGEVFGDPCRCRSRRHAQGGAEGVGAVGTEEQRAGAGACGGLCGGCGEGAAAAAAWAGDQEGAHMSER
jgi:hypothetical protein